MRPDTDITSGPLVATDILVYGHSGELKALDDSGRIGGHLAEVESPLASERFG